ncbi:MAG: hypothetical protein JNL01_16040 [Bdellovibrionales bacterium]|nr:hypothetical protein [Bdellovibrionales bacterium]
MNKHQGNFVSALAVLVALATQGCVTAKPLKKLGFNEDTRNDLATFLFLSKAAATGGAFPDNCQIRIKNLDHSSAQPLEFALPVKSVPILVEAAEGNYRFENLYCDGLGTWNLDEILKEPMKLQAGKVSVLSMVKFEFSHAQSNFSIQKAQKRENFQAVQSAVKKMSQLKRKNLYNPYIDKEWSVEVLAGNPEQKFKVSVKKEGESSAKAELLIQRLDRCEDSEIAKNPLLLTYWNVKASYESSKLLTQKSDPKLHTGSEIFENCIDSAIQDFAPATESKVEIEVQF